MAGAPMLLTPAWWPGETVRQSLARTGAMNLQTLYDLLDLMCVYGISAVAQNLLVGYAGIPAVAPTGFGACGGYLAASLALHDGWPTLAGLVVGVIAACAVGFIMSVIAMRLSVEYVILITIAFAIIIIDVF